MRSLFPISRGSGWSSYLAYFTPVCTTEFVEFARSQAEFDKRDVQLLGLSIDSVPAHIAWIWNIEENFGVKVKFPVIADLDTKVAQLYGTDSPRSGHDGHGTMCLCT